jgi:hypothetical protein
MGYNLSSAHSRTISQNVSPTLRLQLNSSNYRQRFRHRPPPPCCPNVARFPTGVENGSTFLGAAHQSSGPCLSRSGLCSSRGPKKVPHLWPGPSRPVQISTSPLFTKEFPGQARSAGCRARSQFHFQQPHARTRELHSGKGSIYPAVKLDILMHLHAAGEQPPHVRDNQIAQIILHELIIYTTVLDNNR